MVRLCIVEGDEVGTLFGWEFEPCDDLLDALLVGKMVVELEVVAGRTPWIAASDPGQKKQAERIPCCSASTQSGVPDTMSRR